MAQPRRLLAAILSLALITPAMAADRPGVFDYYVLALSWSPNWCLREGDDRGADQCEPRHDFGWTLHGLWPQHERGYPQDCAADRRDPSRAESDAMADIMGSGGLAWYQWRKHGRCSGLDGPDYYALSRAAYDRIARPTLLRELDQAVRLPASVIEEAFIEANPDLAPGMITITCRDAMIQEARLCLTRDLTPRQCGADIARDCTLDNALFTPIR